MVFRPLHPRRHRPSRLSRVFPVVCAVIVANAAQAQTDYTFTLVADSTGPIADFGGVPSPALSGQTKGQVMYQHTGLQPQGHSPQNHGPG